MTCGQIQKQLKKLSNKNDATFLQRYFKTGPGEYGANDRFRGIRVPVIRKIANQFRKMPLSEAKKLLKSPFHEDRIVALLILIHHFRSADEKLKTAIYNMYLAHTKYINNWDLVDCSAGAIVGKYLEKRDRGPLYVLAKSPQLWERRIAIIATMPYIRSGDVADTFRIAEILLKDQEDLIHKAVGWMMREAEKHAPELQRDFLRRHPDMPRTMLRYAIERFPEEERRRYLNLRSESAT